MITEGVINVIDMDTNYLKRLYNLHKNDKKEALQKIIDSSFSSKEAVYIAKQILNERNGIFNENNNTVEINALKNNIMNDDIHQIAVDIRFLRNVVILELGLAIISAIIFLFM